jgi:glutaredoxin 2
MTDARRIDLGGDHRRRRFRRDHHQVLDGHRRRTGEERSRCQRRRIATAKTNLIADALNNFKVEAAQTYATAKALEATEASLARALENSVQGIYSRLNNMTQRLDSLITIANRTDRH